jgi:hypothetical protein
LSKVVKRRIFVILELGLLPLYNGECLRCDLWCLVLSAVLETLPTEYQPFNRGTSTLIRGTVANFRALKKYEVE